MKKLSMLLAFVPLLFLSTAAQTSPSRTSRPRPPAVSRDSCVLNGTYRVDVANSDRLYSVVKDAQSAVPFGEQQQFFIDLTTRLTPPDILAVECVGRQVSVASSRASKITYLADGKTRRERGSDGAFVNSRITLTGDALTFVSTGRGEDNVNVAFEGLEEGRTLRVTRRIYAKQLAEPIVIRTVYERMSPVVEWGLYGRDNLVAGRTETSRPARSYTPPESARDSNRAGALRRDFSLWLESTNRRDIDGQMRFYMPVLKAFYLTRNTPRQAVRIEKQRIFGAARAVDIRSGEPEIIFQNQGEIAIMRFVKEYRVAERSRTRSGAVVQELRWQRIGNAWRIFSERDVRVLR